MKDIEIIDIDYTGKDPAYKKEDEVDLSKIPAPWIVPEEGPIYGDSVRVIGNSGLDLIPGTDFEVVEPVTDLTQATGKAVHLYVELKPHIVASGGKLSLIYQRVGKPVISVKTLLQMLEDMVITGKPIDWVTQVTGKPATYYPAWHSHDIQNSNEMIGFGGLVELFSRMTWEQQANGPKVLELITELQTKVYDRLNYIQKLKWGAIFSHIRNYNNPHGIVPVDVNLGNVANYYTATPQQDSDGERQDLYSTPMGFKRILDEAEPVSEEFISQNELPFGYYGSGIYLPPPITGSFEGLGGDIEDGCFCLEGNGWLVGLMRAYDGRVKNLYYIYNQDYKDRNATRSPWLNTYVQYQHPVITAAGKQANYIISGSNDQVLMIGDNPAGTGDFLEADLDSWWIAASNSTFDPNSHTLKKVNIKAIRDSLPNGGVGVAFQPTKTHIHRVGDWVYLFATLGTTEGDLAANFSTTGALANYANWQTRFWRIPYTDLLDPAKTVITFTPVNVSFDNLQREYRANQPGLFMQRLMGKSADGTTALGLAFNYTQRVKSLYINRRKTFVVVPNPNNKRMARVKVIIPIQATYDDPVTGGPRGIGAAVIANYDWDVVSNTWRISSNWDLATVDVKDGSWANPTTRQTQYVIATPFWQSHATRFASIVGSWIPGYGWVSLGSKVTGQTPFQIILSQVNRDGNISRDYEYMGLPNDWTDGAGQSNHFSPGFNQRSPFGVAGFPRHYSDLYALTSGNRQYPVEMFTAENETGGQQIFYRITEGGADDGFTRRESLQSEYIDRPIFGRKTNSNFGIVKGLNSNLGQACRPKMKDKRSRGVGLFQWCRRSIHLNPGAGYDYSFKTDYNGNIGKIAPESDGSVIINLDLDYTLDTGAKIMYAKANKAKQVRIPRALYVDLVTNALGAHASQLVDIACSFYLDINPGVPSAVNSSYSMWNCIYHTKAEPNRARMIVGIFNWQVASTGSDGIRVARFENMRYPFKTESGSAELKPGNLNNILNEGVFRLEANSSWGVVLNTGLDVNQQHVEILDIAGQTAGNIEQIYHTGLRITTPGNAASGRITFRRRGNADLEATVRYASMHSFNNEYNNHIFANGDHGWLYGIGAQVSGGAMDLLSPWNGTYNDQGIVQDKFVMLGATYVEGNWSVFINSDVLVTFNGNSMTAKMTNWDLRDLTDVYKNQTFYIYCIASGSVAEYEVTKILRDHNSNGVLAAIITTDDFGIVTIQRKQSFSISGFPLTRTRDMGVPVSSGALTEQGTYRFLKRAELYQN